MKKRKTKKSSGIPEQFFYHTNADLDLVGFDYSLYKVIIFIVGIIIAIPCFILMPSLAVKYILYLASFLCLSAFPAYNLVTNIKRGRILCESLFVLLSGVLFLLISEFSASVLLVFGYDMARLAESAITDRAREQAGKILDLLPEEVLILEDGLAVRKKPKRVRKGDYLGVSAGMVIPVDGIVIEGSSSIDYSALTKESSICPVVKGSTVLSGGTNTSDNLIIQSSCEYADCFAQKIYGNCQKALESESEECALLSKVLRYAVPALLVLCLILGVIVPIFSGAWSQQARVCAYLLLLACPYGIYNALNLASYAAIAGIFSAGAVISDARVLSLLVRVDSFICNKTCTLTEQEFVIEDVMPVGLTINNFLSLLTNVESISTHPIAKSLRSYCGITEVVVPEGMIAAEIPGKGIEAKMGRTEILVGNANLLFERGVYYETMERGGNVIYASVNGVYCGAVVFSNKLRGGIYDNLEIIRSHKMQNMALLSGDLQSSVRSLANSLGFTMIKGDIDPNGKTEVADYLMENKARFATVAYLGDELREQQSACHTDISISSDMLQLPDGLGESTVSILGEGISAFARILTSADGYALSSKVLAVIGLLLNLVPFLGAVIPAFPAELAVILMNIFATASFIVPTLIFQKFISRKE